MVTCLMFQYIHLQYHDAMMPILTGSNSKRNTLYTDPSSLSRHFEKWRRRRKRVFSSPHVQETINRSSPHLQHQQVNYYSKTRLLLC